MRDGRRRSGGRCGSATCWSPGLTDGFDNVEKVAEFCGGLKNIERVEILRFHQMGRDKWDKLGIPYALDGVEPPDAALTRARAWAIPRAAGLTVF